MTIGVYAIINIKTSQVYIGSSRNLENRFNNHKQRLKNGCHHSTKLQTAWDEYGAEAFTFCLLQEVKDPVDLIEVEQKFIDQYKAWQDYNIQEKATRSGIENTDNPYHCDRPMRKNGKTKTGATKYRCSCGFNCSESELPPHRPTIGDKPMTQVELNRRYRAKKREAQKK